MKRVISGFTLIETIMTLTIVSILLSIAIPSYNNYAGNNQLRANVNELSSALQYARSQAIRLKRNVTICSSTDLENCSNSIKWENGWIVRYVDDSDTVIILRVRDALTAGTVRSNGLVDAAALTFSRSGSISSGERGGTFVSCDDRGDTSARGLIVNNLGFVHIAYDQDDNDIDNDHQGNDVSCPS